MRVSNTLALLGLGLAAAAVVAAKSRHALPVSNAADLCEQRLRTFDTLDFEVFSHEKWDRLGESHAQDITVTWPDGHETHGLAKHIEDLKGMFVASPDTRVSEHPIKICSGDYTAVTGVMEGTFSRPMPGPDGKMIAPTGKAVKMTMVTIGHWKGSTMDHEWLFWDNQTYLRQMGLMQ